MDAGLICVSCELAGDTDRTEPLLQFCVVQNKISFIDKSQSIVRPRSPENSLNTNPMLCR